MAIIQIHMGDGKIRENLSRGPVGGMRVEVIEHLMQVLSEAVLTRCETHRDTYSPRTTVVLTFEY